MGVEDEKEHVGQFAHNRYFDTQMSEPHFTGNLICPEGHRSGARMRQAAEEMRKAVKSESVPMIVTATRKCNGKIMMIETVQFEFEIICDSPSYVNHYISRAEERQISHPMAKQKHRLLGLPSHSLNTKKADSQPIGKHIQTKHQSNRKRDTRPTLARTIEQ